MTLPPGTYKVHDPDSGRALAYYSHSNQIGTWEVNNHDDKKWYIKCYPGSSCYAIQSVVSDKYIGANGTSLFHADEGNAAVLNIEHQSQDFYVIKLTGTNSQLEHPNVKVDSYIAVNFTNKNTPQACRWRFEKLSDNAGSPLSPNQIATAHANTSIGTDAPVYINSSGPSVEDALFYTDALFNTRRALFTRAQRRAILDWARRMGATNVPTMEAFDAYERMLDADEPVGQNAS